MTPDDYTELCELYALGALDREDRLEFERHLVDCENCRAGLEQAIELNEMILTATPRVEPSSQLRRRVLAGFEQSGKPRRRRPCRWGGPGRE